METAQFFLFEFGIANGLGRWHLVLFGFPSLVIGLVLMVISLVWTAFELAQR